jgi:8-oxo-dGTP pyrophosphatase MutT (NUDIX family)
MEIPERLDLESDPNPWTLVGSREIYSNPWITVREDQVLRPDGKPGIYGVVGSRAATGVVAVDGDFIYLVGQYRYPTENYSWELIEGGADEGEEPLDAIKRELLEEAGLQAGCWRQLGPEIHLSNCFSSERGYLFVATDLTKGEASPDGTECLKVRRVHRERVRELLESGFFVDSMTIVGLYRYFSMLELGDGA